MLTVEFNVHFLKPAKTGRVIAVGQVVQAGRTLTMCEGSVFDATRTRVLARMTTTMMAVPAASSEHAQVTGESASRIAPAAGNGADDPSSSG